MGKIRITEIYGPVIQGEGPVMGVPTLFIRTAGCGYRCTWCDSMYSVLPSLYKGASRQYTTDELITEVQRKPPTRMITLTGGDPALYDFTEFIKRKDEAKICVETQGQLWPKWFSAVDYLVVSPKAPSAGMSGKTKGHGVLETMVRHDSTGTLNMYVKIVVDPINSDDILFVEDVLNTLRVRPVYLQPVWLTSDGQQEAAQKIDVLLSLFSKRNVCIIPQVHKLVYGERRGI